MYRHVQAHPGPHLSNGQLLGVLGVIALAVLLALLRADSLPYPEPTGAPRNVFSEGRARIHLNGLLELGPQRTVGSEANEVKAPELIIKAVDAIKKDTGAKIEIDRQWGSGSFSLDFLGRFTSVYHDVQNVLVMLHGTKHPPEHGVLMLSAHYDTPVGTRGASDNTANVANLLEILRVLAHDRPERSCLFMFTGAEETILQGSHSFAHSGHKWVPHVKAFVNLEAAGTGGRELMFQATDVRLAKAWARASPFPHGSIVGQEVFQSGIIPSDTDFRMYVSELKIAGIDMANVDNGHNYHTILDNAGNVPAGAMQRYGSNVLETTRAILSDEELWSSIDSPQSAKLFVFFDVLGLFVVVLPTPLVFLLIIVGGVILWAFFRLTVFSVMADECEVAARWETLRRSGELFLRSVFVRPVLTALIVHLILPLAYYSRPWFVIFLYAVPTTYGIVASLTALQQAKTTSDKEVPLERKELLTFAFAVAQWALLAIILIINGKGSFYIAYAWSVIPAALRLLYALGLRETLRTAFSRMSDDVARARLQLVESKSAALAGATYGIVVPLLLTLPLLLVVVRFFVPITGRSGSRVPGDVIVAIVAGFVTYLLFMLPSTVFALASPQTLLSTRKRLFYMWLGGIAVVICLRVVYGHGNGAFSASHAKRIYAIHVDAIHIDKKEESFIWVVDADSSSSDSTLKATQKTDPFFHLEDLQIMDCNKRDKTMVYCGLPWFLPLKSEISKTVAIPSKSAGGESSSLCKLTKTKEESVNGRTRRVHLCLNGSERANIFFRDAAHGGPSKWSLEAELAPTAGHLYLLLAHGKPREETCLWVEVPSQKPLQVAWACYYVEEQHTSDMNRFLKALPEWTTPVSFIARWREATF